MDCISLKMNVTNTLDRREQQAEEYEVYVCLSQGCLT